MHLSAKCWEAKRGRTMGLKVRMSWGRRNLPPVDITKFDVHVGVRLCREANPHRALSMHPQQMTDTCEGSKRALHNRPRVAQACGSCGNGLRSEHRCRLVRYLNCLSAMLHHSMTEWILGRLDLDGDYPIRQHNQVVAIQGATTQINMVCRDGP